MKVVNKFNSKSVVPISMAGKKKLWLNILRVVSNVKVFATQDGRTNTTHYLDLYDTYRDQKPNKDDQLHGKKICM